MQPLRYHATRGPLGRQDGSADATMNTLRYSITFVLGIVLPLLVQRWDRGRRPPQRRGGGPLARRWERLIAATVMNEEQRRGLWNGASWGAALYAFGPLSMIGWLWVAHHDWARWRRRGTFLAVLQSAALIVLGVIASALVLGVIVGADELFAWAAGLPE